MICKSIAPVRFAPVAIGLLLGGALGSSAFAQDVRYRDGRVKETIGGVTIQRADEAGSDEAVLNMPFLPGDRVWTDEAGRAEILFAEGEILWIAERSKVDSLGRGGAAEDERLGLRVFAGSFGARVRNGGPGFEFHAPGGTVRTTGGSAFRLDVRAGETMVSVSEGEVLADLGGERMTLRAGERVRFAEGRVEPPFNDPGARGDDFDRWCEDRSTEWSRMARAYDQLPDELDPYGAELEEAGEWVYDQPQGYVYVPRVSYDWAPYTNGRWVYTLYGWTWVDAEPWGFVTSHYGRWGYSSRIGWHWMPKAGFSGAWVAWSSPVGFWNQTIGWCALGFNDRPVGSYAYGGGGRAVARSDSRSAGRGWSFLNRADMGRPDIRRRRVDLPADEVQRAVVWSSGVAPDRGFRESRGGSGRAWERGATPGAVSRSENREAPGGRARVYVRPSPGDSTPELRSDPATTIPSPESRRERGIGQDGFKDQQDNRRGRPGRGGSGVYLDESPDSARARPSERSNSDRSSGSQGDAARTAPETTRDPLLSRFFRSITRPNPASRDFSPPREEGTATRREDPQRDDPSARRDPARERPRPADSSRERAQPPRGERAQPRSAPPPQSTPKGGNESGGARPRPHQHD